MSLKFYDCGLSPVANATKIAVIVPVLNEEAHISATVQHLLPWRDQGAIIIVVDGGSGDQTVRMCTNLVDLVLHTKEGRATQMNAGAMLAIQDYDCEYLVFVHADTLVPKQGLDEIRSALQSRMNPFAWGRFDVRITGQSLWLTVIAWMMNVRSRISSIATGDQTLFMTKTAYQKVGGFPDQLLMEDIQISGNLRRSAKPCCLKQKVTTSGRRWENRGIAKTIWLMWSLRLRYWLGTPANELAKQYR